MDYAYALDNKKGEGTTEFMSSIVIDATLHTYTSRVHHVNSISEGATGKSDRERRRISILSK